MILFLLACMPKMPVAPAMTPYYSLASAPTRALPFQTETQAVEAVRGQLRKLGLSEAAGIAVIFSEQTPFPVWIPGDEPSVSVPRFLVTPERAREHLGEMATLVGASSFAMNDWKDEDLQAAYTLFYVGGIAREMAHGVAWKRGAADYEKALPEERRARLTERAVLAGLAADGIIPSTWPDLWRRLLGGMAKALPSDQNAASEQMFEYGHEAFRAPQAGDPSLSTAFAVSCRISLEEEAIPTDLAARYQRSPTRVRDLLKRSMEQSLGAETSWSNERLNAGIQERQYSVEVDEVGDRFRVDVTMPFKSGGARDPELWRLINGFYQTDWRAAAHDYRMALLPEGFVLRAPWVALTPSGNPPEPDEVVAQMEGLSQLWLKGLIKVNSGLSSVEDVLDAISQGNEP